MKRIAKIFLGGLAGVIGLLILLLIGVNIYLQSAAVQTRVRLATAQAFGSPVEVQRTLYTPWGGLSLTGLSVEDPTIPAAKMMEASRFSVNFEFLPLLQRRFVISEINLTDPTFVLRQTEDEKWVVVPPQTLIQENTKPPRIPKNQSEKPTGSAPSSTAAAEPTRPAPSAPAYTVELRKFSVRRGNVLLTDRRGRPVLRLDDVRIEGQMRPSDKTITGEIRINELSFVDRIHPRKLRAQFVQSGTKLSITEIKSALAGGAIRGEFFVVTPPRGQPEFDLQLRLDEISVPDLISEAHGDGTGAKGTLQGDFRLKGAPPNQKSFSGGGQFSLTEGKLKPLDFIRQIGRVLRIDELQTLDLQRAEIRLNIHDERVWIEDLTLQTDNLIIEAEGPIDFDGDLDLEARLLVNEKIQRGLRGLLNENFTASENAGYKQVSFAITGEASRPETDLAERVLGKTVGKYLGGFLKGMFKSPDVKNDKKKKDDSAKSDGS